MEREATAKKMMVLPIHIHLSGLSLSETVYTCDNSVVSLPPAKVPQARVDAVAALHTRFVVAVLASRPSTNGRPFT